MKVREVDKTYLSPMSQGSTGFFFQVRNLLSFNQNIKFVLVRLIKFVHSNKGFLLLPSHNVFSSSWLQSSKVGAASDLHMPSIIHNPIISLSVACTFLSLSTTRYLHVHFVYVKNWVLLLDHQISL